MVEIEMSKEGEHGDRHDQIPHTQAGSNASLPACEALHFRMQRFKEDQRSGSHVHSKRPPV